MVALTPMLLAARIAELRERLVAVGGEGLPLSLIYCDRCGETVDLRGGLPVGWTTEGDLEGGFTDLCRGCSS